MYWHIGYIYDMDKRALYKGCLEPVLLQLLHDHGRMYGYEITQKVKELTRGELVITEGALYPLLHRLEAEGILQVEMEPIGNRMRKYYSLTQTGNQQKAVAAEELQTFVQTLQMLLQPKTI
ncbi:PadR family transcriptional regulator [Filimonas lacunae]|nr:PadR family transcriptional regulator [Filimonas lacunae]BAV08773.1 transcriptional regulator, PadR family [Filimonas lacunae]